jgi:hypothetical protein
VKEVCRRSAGWRERALRGVRCYGLEDMLRARRWSDCLRSGQDRTAAAFGSSEHLGLAKRVGGGRSFGGCVLRGTYGKTIERFCRESSVSVLRCMQNVDMYNAIFQFLLTVDGTRGAHGVLTLVPKVAGRSRPDTHLLWKCGLGKQYYQQFRDDVLDFDECTFGGRCSRNWQLTGRIVATSCITLLKCCHGTARSRPLLASGSSLAISCTSTLSIEAWSAVGEALAERYCDVVDNGGLELQKGNLEIARRPAGGGDALPTSAGRLCFVADKAGNRNGAAGAGPTGRFARQVRVGHQGGVRLGRVGAPCARRIPSPPGLSRSARTF